jgi:ribokinase
VTPRVAVIGHFEWVTHTRGEVPAAGEIVHLDQAFEEPAGGGAVTAAHVARLGASCRFITAIGDDASADEAVRRLRANGIEVTACRRPVPHPKALTIVDGSGERTIMVTGGRLSPTLDDALAWNELSDVDGVYFIGDDPRTLVAARAARHLVVTARRLQTLINSGVQADVLVASAHDKDEVVDLATLPVRPRALVLTEGAAGGRIVVDGSERRYDAEAPPGPVVDTYGAGDCFAGALTVGLARGLDLDAALALAAQAGASALTWRGGLGPSARTPA